MFCAETVLILLKIVCASTSAELLEWNKLEKIFHASHVLFLIILYIRTPSSPVI